MIIKRFSLRGILLIGTALLLIAAEISSFYPNVTTPLERLELSARDLMMRLRGYRPSSDVVIVAIDDFSFSWTGYGWPWPRDYFAKIVNQLNQAGAKVIALDVFLFEADPNPAGDSALSQAFANSRAAVSVKQIYRQTEKVGDVLITRETDKNPLPIYMKSLTRLGLTDIHFDEDAISRSVLAYDRTQNGEYIYNWAFQVASLYMNVDPPAEPGPLSLSFAGQSVPLSQGKFLLVDFAGPAETYPVYSAANVADGLVSPDVFKDKIVLIGATTLTLQDVYATPFSASQRTSGVEIIASAIDTIIHHRYLRIVPPWVTLLLIGLMAILAYLIVLSQRPGLMLTMMTLAMLSYALAGFLLFLRGTYIALISPELMLFLGVVLPTLEQAVSQELEKRRVRALFSRFISPEMVDQLLDTRDLNALNKRANITILFSDIRGFTTMSEKLSPEAVVAILNPYLDAMTRIIHRHGGTVDKYEGDAIVAFFGEPVAHRDHASRAVRAAIEMRSALLALKQNWDEDGVATPTGKFEIGIGINSGEAFVGMVGSAQRINYTAIGDNVNLAARIQDLTKNYRWPLIISQSTYEQVRDEFEAEFLDSVIVKGRSEPVNIYRIIGRKNAEANTHLRGMDL